MPEPERLRALSRRWQLACETTNDLDLKRHFAGHAAYLAMLAEKLEWQAGASSGEVSR
jgi:hypothetical protein